MAGTGDALQIGCASLTIQQFAARQTDPNAMLLREDNIRVAWVNAGDARPVRIPSTVLEALQ